MGLIALLVGEALNIHTLFIKLVKCTSQRSDHHHFTSLTALYSEVHLFFAVFHSTVK